MSIFPILEGNYILLITFTPSPKSYMPKFTLPLPYAYYAISANFHSSNTCHYSNDCPI